jgi:hypothetical protein
MNGKRKNIYDDLERDLRGFPVGDYVRAYAKAYLEADVETIRKLQGLLIGDASEHNDPGAPNEPDAPIGAPIQPRPHLNSGAIALPEPDNPDPDNLLSS